MKYYTRHTNKNTGKTAVMPSPTFTSKKAAEEWSLEFMRRCPVAIVEVVPENEPRKRSCYE